MHHVGPVCSNRTDCGNCRLKLEVKRKEKKKHARAREENAHKVAFKCTDDPRVAMLRGSFSPLTVSPGRLQRRCLSDGSSPHLRLPQVRDRVLDQRNPKALLHSLPGHPGAHPPPLERVEIGGEVGPGVRAVRPSERPAAHTVRQVKHYLRPAG